MLAVRLGVDCGLLMAGRPSGPADANPPWLRIGGDLASVLGGKSRRVSLPAHRAATQWDRRAFEWVSWEAAFQPPTVQPRSRSTSPGVAPSEDSAVRSL